MNDDDRIVGNLQNLDSTQRVYKVAEVGHTAEKRDLKIIAETYEFNIETQPNQLVEGQPFDWEKLKDLMDKSKN